MFFLIIYISTCSIFVTIIFYLQRQLNDEKQKQIHMMRRINSTKEKQVSKNDNIIIRFIPTIYKKAISSKNCSLKITPLENSFELRDLKINEEVEILDKCECNKLLWFYVNLYRGDNVNNRGWVRCSDVTTALENTPLVKNE